MHHIAIFASGTGSNAEKIIAYFRENIQIKVSLVVSNKPDAKVLAIAVENGVPTLVIHRTSFYSSKDLLNELQAQNIDLVVLAGFLWLTPKYLVEAYPNAIINIHPALLPKYGGKGMYGHHVHEAVKAANETESGITIHYVNENYDEGAPIFQAKCPLSTHDSPTDIAKKVLALEHHHLPRVIESLLTA